MVTALQEKFRVDFEMFEYDISEYVKYATESQGIVPDVIEISENIDEVEDNDIQVISSGVKNLPKFHNEIEVIEPNRNTSLKRR